MDLNSRSSRVDIVSFDFSSPTSVMLILKTLRTHAEITPSVRNEIRDLIFSYTNGNSDEAVRQTIESRLLAAGITPENIGIQNSVNVHTTASTPLKEVPKAGFSRGRVAPSFTPPSVSLVEQSPQVPAPAKPEVVATEILLPAESAAKTNQTIPRIVPTIPTASTSSSGMHDVAKPKAVNETVVPSSPKVSVSQAAESASPLDVSKAASFDTTELLERIRVIKADINARVGNPVNLVSINNAVGREYMSSLLEAMKQLGSGNAPTITNAMKRLEIAYEQALSIVEMTASAGDTAGKSTSSQEVSVAPSARGQLPQVPASVTTEQASKVVPEIPVPEKKATSVPAPVQPVAPTITREVIAPVSQVTTSNPPLGATRSVVGPAQAQSPSGAKPATRIQMSASPADVMRASESPASVPIHSSKFSPAQSVAMATPLRKVEELPTLSEVKNRSESGNPLYTGEISDGLEQLLSEWSIFRKSGVFGTGPHGSNHPLFKKLAGLKIPLIIAGRFEGATEEVRQSITDYMNGWRYEQGIVYEKEETFEEYLRRVVRHIIDSK